MPILREYIRLLQIAEINARTITSMVSIVWLDNVKDPRWFPDPRLAMRDPNGLLAAGGELSPERIIAAYHQGIFPWYSEGEPVLWWSPDPRAVLLPDELDISRSLRKTLKRRPFTVRSDTAFRQVMTECAAPRSGQLGTWITEDVLNAYCGLHEMGIAHSIECWQEDQLVGGLYGIALGKVFFGESMFSRTADASKIALVYLTTQLMRWDFGLIDCQVSSAHLRTLGARDIPRDIFLNMLNHWVNEPGLPHGQWRFDDDAHDAAFAYKKRRVFHANLG